MSSNNKPSFSEWLSDKNITFIIISILVIYALERFSKNIHNDLVTPLFNMCLEKFGHVPIPSKPRSTVQKILLHVLELSFTVVLLYIVSRFVFKHGRLTTTTNSNVNANNNTIICNKKSSTI